MAKNLLSKIRPPGEIFTRTGDPFYDLQQQMNRLFESFWLTPPESRTETFVPAIDVQEDDKEIRVSAELPGMDEKDIDVTLTDESLIIEGEKKSEHKEEEKGYTYRESRYGKFRRVFDLPTRVDQNKAHAEFKKGVLHVTIPKAEEAKTKAKKLELKGE